jgi:hypothetical protein
VLAARRQATAPHRLRCCSGGTANAATRFDQAFGIDEPIGQAELAQQLHSALFIQ